jgi:hypothetical protein
MQDQLYGYYKRYRVLFHEGYHHHDLKSNSSKIQELSDDKTATTSNSDNAISRKADAFPDLQ